MAVGHSVEATDQSSSHASRTARSRPLPSRGGDLDRASPIVSWIRLRRLSLSSSTKDSRNLVRYPSKLITVIGAEPLSRWPKVKFPDFKPATLKGITRPDSA